MARYTGPVCRLCRREGQKLFLKGERCYSEKCSFQKHGYAPGQHGQRRGRKLSEYGLQLREKQKTRRYYGVLESQMLDYFNKAINQPGVAGTNLLVLLESRLDNVVYRLGFASSRAEARVLIVQGHFTVNGKKVDIPSYLINVGDTVAVKDASKSGVKFKAVLESNEAQVVPAWLNVNKTDVTGKCVEKPSREDIDLDVQEQLIVELYSK